MHTINKKKGLAATNVLTLHTKTLNCNSSKSYTAKIAALMAQAIELRDSNRQKPNIPHHLNLESEILFCNAMQVIRHRLGGDHE